MEGPIHEKDDMSFLPQSPSSAVARSSYLYTDTGTLNLHPLQVLGILTANRSGSTESMGTKLILN